MSPRRASVLFTAMMRAMLVLLFMLPTAPAVLAAPAAQDILPCAEVVRNPLTGALSTLRTCQSPLPAESDAATIARAFLSAYHQAFDMPAELSDLRLLSIRHGLDSSHVLFQQTHADLPVVDAYVSVHIDRAGSIQVLHSRYLGSLSLDTDETTVSADQATMLAKEAIGFTRGRGQSQPPRQVILAQSGGAARVAWLVTLVAAEPQGDWEVLIDAMTGAVIKRHNRLIFDRAQVFSPSPSAPAERNAVASPSWPELRTVTLLGLDGSGWLRGDYVDVTAPVGHTPAAAYAPDGNFAYEPTDPRFAEAMVYYHIDSTQRYIQSLGYSAANTPPNGIRDRVTRASAHWFAEDQSFYSISDDALHFGDGGIQDAQDADLIVHEYAHALHHDQVACWDGGDMAAIGEGFGDYLAASRFAGVSDDPACIAEWDSQSYAEGPPYCLRRVDRDRQHPMDVSGDSHSDGELWSRVLWDVRRSAGQRAADTLAIEANFYMPCGASLLEAGQALLDADLNLYGGAQRAVITEALMARGLWPLPSPTILSPTESLRLAPGAAVTITWAANHALNAAYEIEYSLNATAAGERNDGFSGNRLATGYTSFGNAPWRVVEGAAQAGAISHRQSSSLTLAVEALRPTPFNFRYRVSSEAGWDLFEVLLDGQIVLQASGEVGWTSFETTLPAGEHTVIWRYRKDSTVTAGADSVWIDDVHFDSLSTAMWRTIDALPNSQQANSIVWRVPGDASSAVRLRLRARVGAVTSPWAISANTLVIDEPTAVRLGEFGAESGRTTMDGGRRWLWALAGLLGVIGAAWQLRRRRLR